MNLELIDNSSIGKFTTTVLLSVAEMKMDMIVNRTLEGIKNILKSIILIIERGVGHASQERIRIVTHLFMNISSLTRLRRPK